MNFNELLEDLILGHEMEFSYRGEKYSISRNQNGYYFTKFQNENAVQKFRDLDNLLWEAIVNSKNIKFI